MTKNSIFIEAASSKAAEFDKEITLENLYEAIGCELVEVVYPRQKVTGFQNAILICDEEALCKTDTPTLNILASRIAGQRIHGNVILCESEDFK